MTYAREDRYTTTEHDAGRYEAAFAPTAYEDALEAGYEPPDADERPVGHRHATPHGEMDADLERAIEAARAVRRP